VKKSIRNHISLNELKELAEAEGYELVPKSWMEELRSANDDRLLFAPGGYHIVVRRATVHDIWAAKSKIKCPD